MIKFFRSVRFLGRVRKVERRWGLSRHASSIGLHIGKPSLYVFYQGKPLNRSYLGTF